ncbi:RagB/SusD domain-containing protein [Emticicia oligotrophica DSM 17448]|uniref:RagB/SusD domain-containing protein n=1 Tax=Emticicia oligotrophica (strain DSM 17448 / CIP 109782 / MTCC 6937 / GPTSA100-15) TaxID=929562 RepID=A0ABM5N382_EMTOG|nr:MULTISPECIES: RagB/SusD family nutrient uptake outer membrane protein [Emticicia]AFK03779.1 RagB/SusD domain-containing protein [Emticicia oligotrophica DSM 17448]
MKGKYSLKIAVLSLVLTFASCTDLLDVQPRASIDSVTALTTEDAINAAVNGIYDRLQSTNLYGRDLVAIPEALADNGRATNKSGRLNAEYQNQVNAHFIHWQTSYFAINQANLVLDALPKVEKMTQANKDFVEAQALFIRGLLYFELMRAYAYEPSVELKEVSKGGVPLLKSGVVDATQIKLEGRASINDVYESIYADLNNSIAKFTSANKAASAAFANKTAAQAMLSRVALYRGDYANAAKYATDALAAGSVGRFQARDNYVSAWRSANHPESIFEIQYQTNENIGVNTSLQTTYTTLIASGNRTTTGGFGDLVPTKALLDAYESERDSTGKVIVDVRRSMYELGTAGRGTAEIECTKFLGRSGQVNLDNIPVIRVSEMYLNRAEALARTGNVTGALADLNVIRTRAGLPAAKDLAGAALINEILKQRRLELAFEGHRFFDLKRLGLDISKAAPVQSIGFTDFRMLAPLPVREIQANPNLKQNAGY